MLPRFLIVDDDPINNMICSFLIKKIYKDTDLKCFNNAKEGLDYISSGYGNGMVQPDTILLLDINMPEFSGWDFLEEFAMMGENVHKKFSVYVMSSSIYESDKQKAISNDFVEDFIEKPLCQVALKKVIEALKSKGILADEID